MPFFYKQIDVTVPNGQEKQETIVLPPAGATRHIEAIATQVSNDAADLLVNFERERIVDVPTTSIPSNVRWLEIDHDLPAGVDLDVGFRNNTGAALTAQWIAVKFSIVG